MRLYKDCQIEELFILKNRHNSNDNIHYKYEDDLLKRTTSSYIWKNERMNSFLTKIQELVVLMVQKTDISRNYIDFNVHKYNDEYNR